MRWCSARPSDRCWGVRRVVALRRRGPEGRGRRKRLNLRVRAAKIGSEPVHGWTAPTRRWHSNLPSLLAGFRERGAETDPVVIGAHRRPEAVVLSYERYLAMLSGRERVKATAERQAQA